MQNRCTDMCWYVEVHCSLKRYITALHATHWVHLANIIGTKASKHLHLKASKKILFNLQDRKQETQKTPEVIRSRCSWLCPLLATLCTTTFQNLKQIVFRLFRTLLPGLWLRLPNSVRSPLFSNLYSGLKSMNTLNINFFLWPIKL